jgi:hypothetical protein
MSANWLVRNNANWKQRVVLVVIGFASIAEGLALVLSAGFYSPDWRATVLFSEFADWGRE